MTSADDAGDLDAEESTATLLAEPDPLTSLGYIPQRDQAYIDNEGVTRRLICREDVYMGETLLQTVWFIELGEGAERAVPEPLSLGEFIADLQERRWRLAEPPQDEKAHEQPTPSEAQRAAVERVWELLHRPVDVANAALLRPIVEDKRLLRAQGRKLLLLQYEQKLKVTWTTLFKYLRLYWQSGRRKPAFVPNFQDRGLGAPANTVNRARGRKIDAGTSDEVDPYYISDKEKDWIWKFTRRLLRKKYRKAKDVYDLLRERRYTYLDENGKRRLNPKGKLPSLAQFYAICRERGGPFWNHWRRAGPGVAENLLESHLGTTLQEVVCIAHQYEIDSTIADIWLVLEENRNKIIGKPTLYFIIDRFSKLIVGWHATLDSPSWAGAKAAFYSIFNHKQRCKELGLPYDPKMYPAANLAPDQLIADRGNEFICYLSNSLPDRLHVSVVNLPAGMWIAKGMVECTFAQAHRAMTKDTPGYQLPAEELKRQGENYQHDAMWTLNDFRKWLHFFVILHNTRIHPDMPQRIRSAIKGPPVPLQVWQRNKKAATGVAHTLARHEVWWDTLVEANVPVTKDGIKVEGLHYTSNKLAKELQWHLGAELNGRWRVTVRYDRERTNNVYLVDPTDSSKFEVLELTGKDKQYGNRSFGEAKAARTIIKGFTKDYERINLELRMQAEAEAASWISKANALAAEAIKAGREAGESRTSGRPELRDKEALQDAIARAEKLHAELLAARDALAASPPDTVASRTPSPAPTQAPLTPAVLTASEPVGAHSTITKTVPPAPTVEQVLQAKMVIADPRKALKNTRR